MRYVIQLLAIAFLSSLQFLSFSKPLHPDEGGLYIPAVHLSSFSDTTKKSEAKSGRQTVKKSQPAKPRPVSTWPGGVIPFRIAEEMPAEVRERIMVAIGNWESQSPLRFQNLDSLNLDDPPYLARFYYLGARGCSAHVGMRDQKQKVNITRINISDRCGIGAVMHEIGHAVGLYHEHQRPGRDEVIKIHWENIKPEKQKSFSLRPRAMSDSIDFESIMMYGSFSTFSVEKKKPVMTKLNGETWKKQREQLSEGDLWKLRVLYPEIF